MSGPRKRVRSGRSVRALKKDIVTGLREAATHLSSWAVEGMGVTVSDHHEDLPGRLWKTAALRFKLTCVCRPY